MGVKLFVGNLPYSTTEDELATLFAQAGTVESVVIITDRVTGQSRGFAFLEMSTVSEAQKAIHMFNGYSLANRELVVNPARSREEPRSQGGRGGRHGSDDRRRGSYGGRGGRRSR
ncbi:MAG: RNA-binding protein [Anaerolineae bacterium]|nr:RNA-binding protein [Caldilineales bacterium]MCX7852157.1 RNA-binding protein [Caldilineales bacterium]MDW8269265.1 RNA-binding protein [Anaerolineae bacterium]